MFSLQRWRDLPIGSKLYLIVGLMAGLLLCELLTVQLAMHTLSAARAFVGAEGLWSKAQKNAAIRVEAYGATRNEADYQAFLADLAVPEGDHLARMELLKPKPDLATVRHRFLQGRIDAADVQPMIDLLQRFYWLSYLSRALTIWGQGDELLDQFRQAGIAYHAAVQAGDLRQETAQLLRVNQINADLTQLEDAFSFTLGVGSRWIERLVLAVLSVAVLIVESIGLSLAFLTSRGISNGLRVLNEAALEVGQGHFGAPIEPRSRDEIGQLTRALNRMGDMLRGSYAELENRVRQRTQELGRSRDQLKVILARITDGITVIDRQGNFVYANDAGARMCGAPSARELLSIPQSEVFRRFEVSDAHGAPFPIEQLPSRLAFQGDPDPPEVLLRFRSPRHGNEERWSFLKSVPIFDEKGSTALVVTIFKDHTDLKRGQDALQFLDEATQVLVSSIDYRETLSRATALAIPQLADHCFVHQETRGALARPDGELFGRVTPQAQAALEARYPPLRAFANQLQSLIAAPILSRGGHAGDVVLAFSSAGKRYRQSDLRMAEELARRIGTAMDHTRLYEVAQQAIATRDQFIQIASHELKTPLTSLGLQLQLGRRELTRSPASEKVARALEVSARQANRLNGLVEDLLDVSRIRAGKMSFSFEQVDLSALVRDVASRFTLQSAKVGSAITLDLAADVVAYVDQSRVEQLLDNLLTNAIKYAPGTPVRLSLRARSEAAILAVEDEGPGIPKDKQLTVFDRFERLSPENNAGLGLGLFIVREIARGHGGSVRVHSELGRGARFIVQLPLAAARAEVRHVV